jgi:hypothetical protein
LTDGIFENANHTIREPIAVHPSVPAVDPSLSLPLDCQRAVVVCLPVAIVLVQFVANLIEPVKLCGTGRVSDLYMLSIAGCNMAHQNRLLGLLLGNWSAEHQGSGSGVQLLLIEVLREPQTTILINADQDGIARQ